MYSEDAKQYVNLVSRYKSLQENDIINSYKIMIEAAVLADRWSEIKFEISKDLVDKMVPSYLKDLVRGDPLKKRLQEKYDILMNIHVNARQIWLKCQEERTKKYE